MLLVLLRFGYAFVDVLQHGPLPAIRLEAQQRGDQGTAKTVRAVGHQALDHLGHLLLAALGRPHFALSGAQPGLGNAKVSAN